MASGPELSREQLLEYVKKQKIKIKKLEGELQAEKDSRATAEQPIPSCDHETSQRIEAMMLELHTLETQLQEKTVEVFRLTRRVEALESAEAEVSQLRSIVEQVQSDSASLHNQLNDAQASLNQLSTTLIRKESRIEELEAMIEQFKDSFAAESSSREDKDRELAGLKQTIKIQTDSLEVLRSKESELKHQVQQLDIRRQSDREEREQLTACQEHEREVWRKQVSDLSSQLQSQIDHKHTEDSHELEREVAQWKRRLELSEDDRLAAESLLTSQIRDLEEKLSAQESSSKAQLDLEKSKFAAALDSAAKTLLAEEEKSSSLISRSQDAEARALLENERKMSSLNEKIIALEKEGREKDQKLAVALAERHISSETSHRFAELEARLRQSEESRAAEREESSVLHRQIQSHLERISDLERGLAIAEQSRDETMKNLTEELSRAMNANEALKATEGRVEELTQQLVAERTDGEAKLEALSEKLKRVKNLLARTKNVLEERENELAAMKDDKRWPQFAVDCRLSLASGMWLLLSNRNPRLSDESTHRWVEEKEYQRWIEEGSAVAGPLPVDLREHWESQLQESTRRSEAQVQSLTAQIDELNSTFAAYKSRAQVALKKVSHEERQRSQQEQQLVDSLNERVRILEEDLRVSQNELEEKHDRHVATESRAEALQVEVNRLQLLIETLESERLEKTAVISSLQELVDQLRAAVSRQETRVDESLAEEDCVAASAVEERAPLPSPPSSSAAPGKKSLLLQRAEAEAKQATVSLREENARLSVELIDLKGLLGLTYEKLATSADAISDLEAALQREREFNASGRQINAEYLVNVLKKFLLSTDNSEKVKLVQVICSLLHLRAEETQLIVDKWSGRGPRTPLINWFLPSARDSAYVDDSNSMNPSSSESIHHSNK